MTGDLLLPTGLAVVTIALWAAARLPEYLTALIFFTLAMVLHVAPADVVFSGFFSSAFWMVLSGFVLGVAVRKVGLADRIASALSIHFTGSWPRMVGGVVLLTYALAFVMPSNMGRIALLMPIVMALADGVGFTEGSRGRIGLALAVGFGTFELSASILPANVPNLVMAGTAERVLDLRLSYLSYLVLHAPVLGLLKGAVLTACICVMFPARPEVRAMMPAATPVTASEIRLAALLIVTVALWVTDTLHGIAPAWIGLAAACVCLLPRVGFLTDEEFAAGVNIKTCLYIAAILGLAAVVAQSGLGENIGREILGNLPLGPGHNALNFGALIGLTTVLNFIVTANGVPALFTPLGPSLADSSGLPLLTVLMIQVIGYATPLLPYQASPIVVAMSLGNVPASDGLKLCLVLAAVTLGVLVPLDYAWFRLLGLVPG